MACQHGWEGGTRKNHRSHGTVNLVFAGCPRGARTDWTWKSQNSEAGAAEELVQQELLLRVDFFIVLAKLWRTTFSVVGMLANLRSSQFWCGKFLEELQKEELKARAESQAGEDARNGCDGISLAFFQTSLECLEGKDPQGGRIGCSSGSKRTWGMLQPSRFVFIRVFGAKHVRLSSLHMHDAQILCGQADMEREKLERAEQEGTLFKLLYVRIAVYITYFLHRLAAFLNSTLREVEKRRWVDSELLQQARDQWFSYSLKSAAFGLREKTSLVVKAGTKKHSCRMTPKRQNPVIHRLRIYGKTIVLLLAVGHVLQVGLLNVRFDSNSQALWSKT